MGGSLATECSAKSETEKLHNCEDHDDPVRLTDTTVKKVTLEQHLSALDNRPPDAGDANVPCASTSTNHTFRTDNSDTKALDSSEDAKRQLLLIKRRSGASL